MKSTTRAADVSSPGPFNDLSGALVSQTYPSGRVVAAETDEVGRLSRVTSRRPGEETRTYLSDLS